MLVARYTYHRLYLKKKNRTPTNTTVPGKYISKVIRIFTHCVIGFVSLHVTSTRRHHIVR